VYSPSPKPNTSYTKLEVGSSDDAQEDWEVKYTLMKNERDVTQEEMDKVGGKVVLMARGIEKLHRKFFAYQARLQQWSRTFKAP